MYLELPSTLLSDSGSFRARRQILERRSWVSGVCRLRELSGLVQRIYWADFLSTLGVVYCPGLVGYARVWRISVAPS